MTLTPDELAATAATRQRFLSNPQRWLAMTRPSRIFHADWSINPRKRWLCTARLHDDSRYVIAAPVPLPDLPR